MTPKGRERRRIRRQAEQQSKVMDYKSYTAYRKMESMKKKMRRNGEDVHLDHIVPLRHHLVCGLTCPANLQIITAAEDQEKANEFKPFRTLPDGREEII